MRLFGDSKAVAKRIVLSVWMAVALALVVVNCSGGGGIGDRKALSPPITGFGVLMVLPPPAERASHLGALKATKVRWVGLDIPLSHIAPAKSVYHWNVNGFEDILRALRQANIHISLKFLGQADWLSKDPNGPHADWDNTLNLTPPRDRAAWQEVVRQVIQRYGRYCQTWQIGNEPDGGGYFRGSAEEYLRYLEWTVEAIRQVQPRATIAAADLFLGLRPPPGSYGDVLRRLVRRPDLFDVLSIHYPLGRPQDSAGIEDYSRAMQEAGIQKPIWNTEQFGSLPCGWLASGQTTHPRTEGGTRLSPAKALIHSFAIGCQVVFLWEWNYSDSGIYYRPAAQNEFRTAVEQLEGTRFLRRIDVGDRDITLYQFALSNDRTILVGWTEVGGRTATLRLRSSQPLVVVDAEGQSQTLVPQDGWVTVTLRQCPQYIRPLPTNFEWSR